MKRPSPAQLERASLAAVAGLVAVSLAFLLPVAARRLAATAPSSHPRPTATAPPPAVLLQAELDRDLQGVMILVSDQTVGTAFLFGETGTDLLTAASLVNHTTSLRVIDNTAGSHAVSIIGIDEANGIAEIRVKMDATPLVGGDARTLREGDPVVVLASRKNAGLPTATPAIVTQVTSTPFGLRASLPPGTIGSPVVGYGGKVLGVLLGDGVFLPINDAQPELLQWRTRTVGPALPLAPFPMNLALRGSDQTTAPPGGLALQSVSPSRGPASQDTVVTLQGSGFVAGPMLRVRFLPLASQTGAFDGLAPTLVNPSTLTVKVPAGRVVQDYVVQLINGDGTAASSRAAFTVTP